MAKRMDYSILPCGFEHEDEFRRVQSETRLSVSQTYYAFAKVLEWVFERAPDDGSVEALYDPRALAKVKSLFLNELSTRKTKAFLSALQTSGFLEERDGKTVVKEWFSRLSGRLVKQRQQEAERKRNQRGSPQLPLESPDPEPRACPADSPRDDPADASRKFNSKEKKALQESSPRTETKPNARKKPFVNVKRLHRPRPGFEPEPGWERPFPERYDGDYVDVSNGLSGKRMRLEDFDRCYELDA